MEGERTWEGLNIDMWRYCEGPPRGAPGTYDSQILSVLRVNVGEIIFRREEREVRAHPGSWVINRPGWREQLYSQDLRIVSIHIALDCHYSGADWRGNSIVHLPESARLDQVQLQLRSTELIDRLMCSGEASPASVNVALGVHLDYQEKLCALVRELIAELEPQGLHFEVPRITDERVNRSLRKLSAMPLTHAFSREAIARDCGLSPSQLDRLWRIEMGMTPHGYWNGRRLKYACRRLLDRDAMVKETAYLLGFKQVSHFSQWFYGQMKETPSSFRRHHMGNGLKLPDR